MMNGRLLAPLKAKIPVGSHHAATIALSSRTQPSVCRGGLPRSGAALKVQPLGRNDFQGREVLLQCLGRRQAGLREGTTPSQPAPSGSTSQGFALQALGVESLTEMGHCERSRAAGRPPTHRAPHARIASTAAGTAGDSPRLICRRPRSPEERCLDDPLFNCGADCERPSRSLGASDAFQGPGR